MPVEMGASSSALPADIGALINRQSKLHIVEWQHMDLYKFYPMALAASWTVRGLLYPLNVIKARLQLQKQNHAYRGTIHAFRNICTHEGYSALYRGFWVTLPQIGGSFVYSTIYEKMRSVLHLRAKIESTVVVSALAGGIASTFTQIVFVPTDVISQHMMIHNNPKHFAGDAKSSAVQDYLRGQEAKPGQKLTLGLRTMGAIYHVDGLRGFYRGFISSLMLYFPHSMCFWSAYYIWLNLFKRSLAQYLAPPPAETGGQPQITSMTTAGELKGLLLLQAVSGGLGGITAAFCTNSLEVLRIRIQVHRTGYAETIKRLYLEEGRRVFIKGLAPRMINNGMQSFLIMTGYETIKRLCVLPQYRDAIVW